MEWIVGVLLALVGYLLVSKKKLKKDLWRKAADGVLERINKGRVEHDKTEADARARLEAARAKLKEVDDETPDPPDSLDDALARYNERRKRTGSH